LDDKCYLAPAQKDLSYEKAGLVICHYKLLISCWCAGCHAGANNQTTQTIDSLCVGTYCVTITDDNACTWDTCVSVIVGINELNLTNSIKLFPNPNSGEFTIEGNYQLPAIIELYDITGRQMFSQLLTSNQEQVDVSHLSSGMYVWQLGTARGKLVIE